MVNFESVTFGGSGLDRAAHLRTNPAVMQAALQDQTTECLVFWQGKPLVSGSDDKRLVRLAPTHPIFEQANEPPIFMGLEGKVHIFAQDISGWQPETEELPDGSFVDLTLQHFPGLPEDYLFHELRAIMTQLSAHDAELAATGRSLFAWHQSHPYCSKCGAKSDAAQQGWQRICPACGGQHFPRTDPVVIMLITYGNKVLLGRSPNWPEGMYSLLAGFLEPGETPEAAVRREVFEEAGIKVGDVTYLGSQPWAFPSSLMLGYSGAALTKEIEIDPVEIEEAIWISREEMMEVFAETHPVMKRPRNGAIAHFILKNWLEDRLD